MADLENLRKIKNQSLESKDVILPNDKKWYEKISNYKTEKNYYNFNPSQFPGHVTHKFQKEQENSFNPITQKYTDKSQEKEIRQFDRKTKIDDISQGYDYELNFESSYNIINLRNKLKGLNYSLDKYTREKKKKEYDNPASNLFYKPYNIISNHSFKEQYYIPPDKRDKIPGLENCNEGIMPIKKKKEYLNDKYNKDYDIISNKYKSFHKQKEQADREIQTLTAAKKIQNLRTYDIIKRKFLNPEIEEKFRLTHEQKQMSKINNAIKDKIKNKNYIIRNPINNEVYDEEAQKEKDKKEFERLEQYRAKDKIETYYRSLDINNHEKVENRYKVLNKPMEHKIINDRGYNIVNHTLFNEGKSNKFKKYKIMSDWEKLKSLADEKNSTFDKKTIYKSMYDKSEVNENYKNFLINRRKKLKELNPFSEDPIFKVNVERNNFRNNTSFTKTFNTESKTKKNLRCNTMGNETRKGRTTILYKFNNINMSKKDFYENNRNILDYDNKDSIPVLVDKNINTRYFKNYITKLRK